MLATADVVFSGGFLDGLSMSGISVLRGKDGEIKVLLPARAMPEAGGSKTALLRPTAEIGTSGPDVRERLKAFVVSEYRKIATLPDHWKCGRCGSANDAMEAACVECGAAV